MPHQDNNYIDRIRKGIPSRNEVITELYSNEKIKGSIYAFVLKNGGSQSDAQDIFTHSIVAFVKQCNSPVFKLKNTLSTYMFSIARYEWIRQCKNSKRIIYSDEEISISGYEPSIEEKIIGQARTEALKKALTYLDDKCKKVLTMWASQVKMREIAITMNYSSEGMARKKKHNCLNKLRVLIKDI